MNVTVLSNEYSYSIAYILIVRRGCAALHTYVLSTFSMLGKRPRLDELLCSWYIRSSRFCEWCLFLLSRSHACWAARVILSKKHHTRISYGPIHSASSLPSSSLSSSSLLSLSS